VAREVAAIFQAPGLTEAKKLRDEFKTRWHKELPEAVEILERVFGAATQFYAFPEAHWPRLRTTNGLERLHGEIKRRIRGAGAFPDRASALRLVTAVAQSPDRSETLDRRPTTAIRSWSGTRGSHAAGADLGFVDASVLAVVERLGEVKLATLEERQFRAVRPRNAAAFRLLRVDA
jgi:transposase-like protein